MRDELLHRQQQSFRLVLPKRKYIEHREKSSARERKNCASLLSIRAEGSREPREKKSEACERAAKYLQLSLKGKVLLWFEKRPFLDVNANVSENYYFSLPHGASKETFPISMKLYFPPSPTFSFASLLFCLRLSDNGKRTSRWKSLRLYYVCMTERKLFSRHEVKYIICSPRTLKPRKPINVLSLL